MFKAGDRAILMKGADVRLCIDKHHFELSYDLPVEVICSSQHITTVLLPGSGKAAEVKTYALVPKSVYIVDLPDIERRAAEGYKPQTTPRKKWSAEESESIRKALTAMVLSFSTSMNRSVPSIEWEMYRALKENGCKG